MKRIVGAYIVVSLILIFFLKSSAPGSDKAWLELYLEKYDNSPVVDLIKDYNKNLYLATSSALYKIIDTNILEEIKIDNKFVNKKILKIYPSKKKSIYVLFKGGNNECIVTEYYNSKWTELGQLEMNHKVFFEDSKYRLWSMDYSSNILLFKDNKWNTIKYNSGFPENYNENLHKNSIGYKWFNPLNFLEDNKGRVWIYSSVIGGENFYISMTEILCYYNDKINVFPLIDLPKKLITSIIEVKPDIFWIGTYGSSGGSIFVFKVIEKDRLELVSLGYSPNNFHEEFLLNFYKDAKGKIWFITQGGWRDSQLYNCLWCLEEDKIKVVRDGIDETYGVRYRHCFYEDLNGNIFVGRLGMGVLLINNKGEIREINRLSGLKISIVRSIIINDRNGNIFFIPADGNYQIDSIQILSNEWLNKTDEIDKIKAWKIVYIEGNIKKDSKGNLWWLSVDANNVSNLIKYDGNKMETIANMSDVINKMENKLNHSGLEISYFTIDSKDRLWFYISGQYVVIYNGVNFEEELDIEDAYKNISIEENYKLGTGDWKKEYFNPIITKKHEIFYSTYSNIYYFDGTKWINYEINSIFGDNINFVSPLFVNSEDNVVANNTKKESYIFENGKWQKSQNYFYNPYDKENNPNVIEYKDNKGNIFLFSRQDGLQYKDSNNNLYKIDGGMCPIDKNAMVVRIFEDIKGDVWFSYYSQLGYYDERKWAVLDISKLKELIEGTTAKITSIEVEHKIIPSKEEIEINKIDYKIKSDSITIKFSLENENNVKVKFSWRLDEDAWSEPISSDSVILRDLLKGKHIFEVKAIDSRGISITKPAKLEFEIDYDYTQKLDKIFERLKSNDNKMVKEAMEKFINLRNICKGYLRQKLDETSDEELKWKIEAVLSRF